MQQTISPVTQRADRETSSDLSSGQIVIVIARWLLIAFAFAVTLLSPQGSFDKIRLAVLVLFGLAIGNFFLHSFILMKRPIDPYIVYTASAVDLGVVTLMIWAFGGVQSTLYVYLYPALLGLALVFPLRVTILLTAVLLPFHVVFVWPGTMTPGDWQALTVRLISMLGLLVIGHMYQRIERDRRRALMGEAR